MTAEERQRALADLSRTLALIARDRLRLDKEESEVRELMRRLEIESDRTQVREVLTLQG